MKLLGYSEMKGTSKRTGRPYDGYRIYFAEASPRVTGMACDSVFCSREILPDVLPAPGSDIRLTWSRRGFCEGFEVTEYAAWQS